MAERRTMGEIAIRVIDWIESQGFPVKPGSRLDRMRAMFLDQNGQPNPIPIISTNDPGFEIALEAFRDLQILGFAVEQLGSAVFPPVVHQRLKRLLKDTTMPQDNLDNTPGRDVQFELWVAAICMKAGMSPTFDEPDNQCTLNGMTFAVAVKRIKSAGTYEDRIRGAVNQINKVNLPGIVVADVSVMLNPTNERIEKPLSDDEYRAISRFTLKRFVADHRDKLDEWFKGSTARGLILIDHHVRLNPEKGWGFETLHLSVNQSPFNQRRRREFDLFFDTFAKGFATTAEW